MSGDLERVIEPELPKPEPKATVHWTFRIENPDATCLTIFPKEDKVVIAIDDDHVFIADEWAVSAVFKAALDQMGPKVGSTQPVMPGFGQIAI